MQKHQGTIARRQGTTSPTGAAYVVATLRSAAPMRVTARTLSDAFLQWDDPAPVDTPRPHAPLESRNCRRRILSLTRSHEDLRRDEPWSVVGGAAGCAGGRAVAGFKGGAEVAWNGEAKALAAAKSTEVRRHSRCA